MSQPKPRPIHELARALSIPEAYVEPYGRTRAKLHLDALGAVSDRPKAKYILVTAITPTPLGEGKTTTTIGLGMALERLGKRSVITLRQSSLGPAFGIKGGGAGGGMAQVVPLDDSILHVTGDLHAVQQAHNQLAALVDNAWYHDGNPLELDTEAEMLRRVLDVNDRFLRDVTIGQGPAANGAPRRTGFDITPASELMAILGLVRGHDQAEVLRDLRARIGRMVVARTKGGRPVTAEEIGGAGAAAVLLRDAVKPTLMQTAENTAALVHTGPFANIAHGNASVVADLLAVRLADYAITEAGFGMDMGGEKFFDIKCRVSGLVPDAAVLVTTVRALKAHTGKYKIAPGKPLPPELVSENPDDVVQGGANLRAHLEALRRFGVPSVVAINAFPEDAPSEVEAIRRVAREAGCERVAVSTVYAQGGRGGEDLAREVMAAATEPSRFEFLYPLDLSLKDKIHRLATTVYGARDVAYLDAADRKLAQFERDGAGKLPICMAKTHLSLSHDAKLKGAPKDYTFVVKDARASLGAGFIYPLAGDIMTMPGLGADPAAKRIDLGDDGSVVGLA